MMIARFRVVGWVAGCASAALCCYLASQRVASERLALAKVDREIVSTRAENARLETEIASRSRLGQIERWNVAFRLGAASPRQYLANEMQLASYVGGRQPAMAQAVAAARDPVTTVAYAPAASPPATPLLATPALSPAPATPKLQTVAAPVAPSAPLLHQAAYVRPAPARLALDAPVLKVALVKLDRPSARLDGILDAPRPKARKTPSLVSLDLGALAAAEARPRARKADQ